MMLPLVLSLALGVTMEEAVRSALENHPELRVAEAQAQAAAARADEARAPLLPRVDANGTYDVRTSALAGTARTIEAPYAITLSTSLLVFDFGASWSRWRSGQQSAGAAESTAQAVARDVVLNVRLAYIDALEARALISVARETFENEQRRVQQIERFVAVGARPEIDLARLRTRVADAQAALVRTENDLLTAKARLKRAMGVTSAADFDVVEPQLSALELEDAATKAMFDVAVEARPDLTAARRNLAAQELNVKTTTGRALPALSVDGVAGYFGSDLLEPGWQAAGGVSLRWALFDGLGTWAAVDAEEAGVRAAQARVDAQEQQIWLDLEEARIGVASTRAQLMAAEQTEASARQLLRLAEARYAEGVGNSIELSDAQLEVTNAAVQRVRVEYDLAAARARLLRALGRVDWQ